MIKPRQLAVFLLIGMVWGSEWIPRQAISAPPLRALALRYAIGAAILAFLGAVRRVRLPDRRSLLAAAIVGVAMLALPSILTSWAITQIPTGLLIVILSLTPLLAALFARRPNGVPLPLIGGVAGTALVLSPGISFHVSQLPGSAAAFAAAVLIAKSIVYVKRRLSDLSPMALAGIQLGAGCAALALASFLLEGRSDWLWTGQPLSWEVALAVFGNALALPLYYRLLQRLESFQLASSQWLVTLVSVAEGFILLRQPPSWELLLGAGIVALSLYTLLTRASKDEEPLTIQITRSPFGS